MRGTVLRYWTTDRRKAGMVVMNLYALFYRTRKLSNAADGRISEHASPARLNQDAERLLNSFDQVIGSTGGPNTPSDRRQLGVNLMPRS